jgi:hypothetical protein
MTSAKEPEAERKARKRGEGVEQNVEGTADPVTDDARRNEGEEAGDTKGEPSSRRVPCR